MLIKSLFVNSASICAKFVLFLERQICPFRALGRVIKGSVRKSSMGKSVQKGCRLFLISSPTVRVISGTMSKGSNTTYTSMRKNERFESAYTNDLKRYQTLYTIRTHYANWQDTDPITSNNQRSYGVYVKNDERSLNERAHWLDVKYDKFVSEMWKVRRFRLRTFIVAWKRRKQSCKLRSVMVVTW